MHLSFFPHVFTLIDDVEKFVKIDPQAKHPARVALFDLDGVLIKPGGYRAAVTDTLHYFSQGLGLGKLAPSEGDIALCESLGITSEWDIVPICLVIILAAIRERHPHLSLSLDTPLNLPEIPLINFRQAVLGVGTILKPGFSPAEALLQAISKGVIFPALIGQAITGVLLGKTRDIYASATSRIFQNFILGGRGFASTYNLAPVLELDSYLTAYDVALLQAGTRKRLLELEADHFIKPAVITARPSLTPAGCTLSSGLCSPEAEMALELLGLASWPAIGYGKISYLADQVGVDPKELLKPSPVQSLAAILASFGMEETEALFKAFQACFSNGEQQLPLPDLLEVHIFEDSPIGIQSVLAARDVLSRSGVNLEMKAWGITSNPDKGQALKAIGASLYGDINAAVLAAFGR